MSIKCMANASLEFNRGSESVRTVIGFNTLPDWVEGTPYYKNAVTNKVIIPFTSGNDAETEEVQKGIEKREALKEEIKSYEEKLEQVKTKGTETVAGLRADKEKLEAEIEELEAKKAEIQKELERGNRNNRK